MRETQPASDVLVQTVKVPRRSQPGRLAATAQHVEFAAMHTATDSLHRIWRGKLASIIVKGFLPPCVLAHAQAAVTAIAGTGEVPHRDAGERHIGRLLQWSAADKLGYFAAAEAFDATCTQVFGAAPSYRDRIETALTHLAGGLPTRALASSVDGMTTSSTIRLLLPGAAFPPHFDRQQLAFHGYDGLRELLDPETMLSFLIPLTTPDAGGELWVYDCPWTPADDERAGQLKRRQDIAEARVSAMRHHLTPAAGDLLVFPAGKFLHEVTAVLGARPRITVGGFCAANAAHDEVLYWS